eukprot:3948380-Prymnesium_polylepis.1
MGHEVSPPREDGVRRARLPGSSVSDGPPRQRRTTRTTVRHRPNDSPTAAPNTTQPGHRLSAQLASHPANRVEGAGRLLCDVTRINLVIGGVADFGASLDGTGVEVHCITVFDETREVELGERRTTWSSRRWVQI